MDLESSVSSAIDNVCSETVLTNPKIDFSVSVAAMVDTFTVIES